MGIYNIHRHFDFTDIKSSILDMQCYVNILNFLHYVCFLKRKHFKKFKSTNPPISHAGVSWRFHPTPHLCFLALHLLVMFILFILECNSSKLISTAILLGITFENPSRRSVWWICQETPTWSLLLSAVTNGALTKGQIW